MIRLRSQYAELDTSAAPKGALTTSRVELGAHSAAGTAGSGWRPTLDFVLEDSPVVGVLALQGDVREHLRALAGCGMRSRLVRRCGELTEVDALIVPGGESTTMSRLLLAFDLMEPLRARLAEGMPAYGSCAGMILLCREILDGRPDQRHIAVLDAVVRRNAFGRQVDSFEADLDFVGVSGGPLRAVFIRAPWVEQAGSGVEVLARVPDVPAAGSAAGRIVAIRQGCVLATAFHPELTGDRRVHQLFCEMVWESRGAPTKHAGEGTQVKGTRVKACR